MDHEEQRAHGREMWEAAAAGWGGDAGEILFRAMLPIAHWMVDAIAPQPGQTVLELAGGTGEVGHLAAELLHPGGRLVETDGAEAMVEAARRRGEARGVQGVEYRTMELEWIDAATASFDAILCRFGYMLAVDPDAALRESRRVLRSGGRLAAAVWDLPEHNPHIAIVGQELTRAGHAPPPDPDAPGPFALSAPGRVVEALRDAGFEDVGVEPIEVVFRAPSLDAWWENTLQVSPTLKDALAALSPGDVYRLRDALDERWSAYADEAGGLALPGRALGVAAGA